jgi:hypothetical protein
MRILDLPILTEAAGTTLNFLLIEWYFLIAKILRKVPPKF